MSRYSVKEITDKASWDAFVLAFKPKTFLHSWEWGSVQESCGEKVWRLGVYRDKRLCGVALLIKIVARRGTFLFCPHGPLMNKWGNDASVFFITYMKELAQKEGAHWVRLSPYVEEQRHDFFVEPTSITAASRRSDSNDALTLLRKHGFRNAPIHMLAEITWELDVSQDEDVIMKGMRKTTRNLVRRGRRDDVRVEFGSSDTLFQRFYALHEATVARQGFVPFAKKSVRAEVNIFRQSETSDVMIAVATHNHTDLAAAIIPIFAYVGYYHHGASLASKIPAAYTLQWEIIKELKERGCHTYNFWGIAEAGDWKHPWKPWKGLTLFKKGFGGRRLEYLHAQDLSLSWRYWGNAVLETIRRIKRAR